MMLLIQPIGALAFVCIASALYCQDIREKYSPPDQYVSQHGVPKNITLYWDSDLTRAASGLLAILLRHALGYQHVRLQQSPSSIPATDLEETDILTEVNITVNAPAHMQLHLHLAKRFRDKDVCKNITHWSSYNDTFRAFECGFEDPTASGQNIMVVNQLDSKYINMIEPLAACLEASSLPFKLKRLNRVNLFQMIRNSNRSFLFVDYDMWAGDPDVSEAALLLNLKDSKCYNEKLNTDITTRVANDELMKVFAPQLLYIANKYTPSLNFLRPVLEIESSGEDIGENTCKWASSNEATVNMLMGTCKPQKITYTITSIVCIGDPGFDDLYNIILKYVVISRMKEKNPKFHIQTSSFDLNCSDPDSVIDNIEDFMMFDITPFHIGIVISNLKNIKGISNITNGYNIPVLFYDTTDFDAGAIKIIASDEFAAERDSMASTWISAGQSLHLTLALQYFIRIRGWTRVAVISEQTPSAKLFMDNLIDLKGLALRDHKVGHNLTVPETEKVLRAIQIENAHIILVNTDYKKAVTILSAAVELKMNNVEEYAWFIREWRPNITLSSKITHFVVSFWCKRGNDVLKTTGRNGYRENFEGIDRQGYYYWPSQAAALINAVLTLVDGFEDVILKYPQAQYDTQSKQVIRQFERSLVEVPVKGITHTLRYKMHMLEEAVVFIEEWLSQAPSANASQRNRSQCDSRLQERRSVF